MSKQSLKGKNIALYDEKHAMSSISGYDHCEILKFNLLMRSVINELNMNDTLFLIICDGSIPLFVPQR